jgi:hypothetical protein
MPSPWKGADVAIGGLTEVGFVPGSSLLLVNDAYDIGCQRRLHNLG